METTNSAYEAPPGRIAAAWWHTSRFAKECWRVFRITKKPSKDEFLVIFKVAGLGILAIGLIGFIVYIAREAIVKGF